MLIGHFSYSQGVVKIRSQYMSLTIRDSENKWDEWSEPEECNVLIVFDTSNLKLNIYSKELQEYDIVDSESKKSEDEVTFVFNCIDKEGKECLVSITKYDDPIDTGKIIVAYPLIAWVYLVYWL